MILKSQLHLTFLSNDDDHVDGGSAQQMLAQMLELSGTLHKTCIKISAYRDDILQCVICADTESLQEVFLALSP